MKKNLFIFFTLAFYGCHRTIILKGFIIHNNTPQTILLHVHQMTSKQLSSKIML